MLKPVLVIFAALLLTGCETVTDPAVSSLLPAAPDAPALGSTDPATVGRDHFERGEYALAEASFRTAVERNPTDSSSWTGLAASYDQLGKFRLADRAYDHAIEISGYTFEILNNRGFSYLLRGNKRKATEMFQRARASHPDDPTVNNNLAILSQWQ